MKNPLSGKLAPIAAGLAAGSLMFGWLGVAGALPSAIQQPFSQIAEVIDPTTSAPEDTTTTVAGEPTTTAADDATTTTAADDTTTTTSVDTPTTTADDDADENENEDGPSDKNCGRFQAGPNCKRPVTPGWADEDHQDNHEHSTATAPSGSSAKPSHSDNNDD